MRLLIVTFEDIHMRWNRCFCIAMVAALMSAATPSFAATFGTGVANFVWAKFGIDQGTADSTTEVATLLNAAVSAQGTKAAGQTWATTATVSFT